MYWGDHMSAGGWIFSILASLVFLALIVALIYWLLSATTGSSNTARGDSRESAGEILDRRLASGELTVEQYRQMREALDTRGRSQAPARASHGPQPSPPRAAGA